MVSKMPLNSLLHGLPVRTPCLARALVTFCPGDPVSQGFQYPDGSCPRGKAEGVSRQLGRRLMWKDGGLEIFQLSSDTSLFPKVALQSIFSPPPACVCHLPTSSRWCLHLSLPFHPVISVPVKAVIPAGLWEWTLMLPQGPCPPHIR